MSCAARALLIAAALAGPPGRAAAELCVLPLEGGGPVSAVEAEQPWRIISEVASIPGYPLPLIWPYHRKELYTVRGMQFEPLGTDYPVLQFFQWRNFARRPDGTVIGFGKYPTQLWVLRPGEAEFSPLPDVPPFVTTSYDAGEDRVYVGAVDGGLYELRGEKAVLSPLTGLPLFVNGALPRRVETLGGYLAATETALWFHPDGAGQWQEIADAETGGTLYDLRDARIVPLDRTTVAIGLGQAIVVLRAKAGQRPEWRYSLPWSYLPQPVGGSVLTWRYADGSRSSPAYVVQLTPDGPVPPSGDPVPPVKDHLAARLDVAPDQSSMLVRSGEKAFVFDGSRMMRRPDLDSGRIGFYPRFVEMLGKTYLTTTTGWYAVVPGVTLSPAPFPVAGLLVEDPLSVPSLGGALLRDRRSNVLWFTDDGVTFKVVQNRAGTKVRGIGGALPGRVAAIVVTEKGAAIVQSCDG